MTNKETFEHIGWYKEIYYLGKYITNVILEEKDREIIGYNGRKEEVLQVSMKTNKGLIKKGSTIKTIMYPICGKLIDKPWLSQK
jgi:hypothetical protein